MSGFIYEETHSQTMQKDEKDSDKENILQSKFTLHLKKWNFLINTK